MAGADRRARTGLSSEFHLVCSQGTRQTRHSSPGRPPSSSDIDLGPLSLSGLNVIQQVQRPPEGPRSEGHSPLVMLSKLSGTFQQLKVGQNKLSGTIFGNRDRWLGKL